MCLNVGWFQSVTSLDKFPFFGLLTVTGVMQASRNGISPTQIKEFLSEPLNSACISRQFPPISNKSRSMWIPFSFTLPLFTPGMDVNQRCVYRAWDYIWQQQSFLPLYTGLWSGNHFIKKQILIAGKCREWMMNSKCRFYTTAWEVSLPFSFLWDTLCPIVLQIDISNNYLFWTYKRFHILDKDLNMEQTIENGTIEMKRLWPNRNHNASLWQWKIKKLTYRGRWVWQQKAINTWTTIFNPTRRPQNKLCESSPVPLL